MDKAQALLDAFRPLEDWELKYGLLIDLGHEMPAASPGLQSPENLIQGCQSQVWLRDRREGSQIYFEGDSDAFIARGLVALVTQVYSGLTAAEILSFDFDGFVSELGLDSRLSMARRGGLQAMVAWVRQTATQA